MGKIYGVTCDRCEEPIQTPSRHYQIRSKNMTESSGQWVKDLCPGCHLEVVNFIRRNPITGETK